jgi:serine/threonine-protein kinase
MIGTPEYMSPEQLSGDPIDARSDIYSLGIVVFALLTNRLPFPAVTTKETLVARLTKPPFHLWEVMPEVEWPSALQAALNSALAPEPSERFAEVTQLARAVVEAVAPVPMAPVGLGAGGWDSSLSPPPTPLPSPQPSPPPAPIASPVAWAPPESTTPVPPAAPLPPPKPAITRKHLIIGGSMVGGSIMVSGLLWVLARLPGPVGEDSSRLVRTTDSIPAKPAKAETTSAVGPRGKTKTQAVVVEARPADLIARAREDLRKGRLFADEGQYVSADRWYDLARQRVDSVRERASDNAEAASLEREIAQRRADNRAACRTEQEIERRSNKKPRDCP